MAEFTKPFQLLIKPVSGDCNLACSYCFYTRVPLSLYGESTSHLMSDQTLEALTGEFLGYGFNPTVFSWQGGEPTLAGLDFFRKVVELQQKLGTPGQVVGNAFQTNGILIDDQWSSFLAQYRFLVGLSIDGPPHVHDAQRIHASGSASSRQVMRAARRFQRDGVAFNILTVISRANQDRGKEVIQWMHQQGFTHVQFIPCVEVDPATGKVTDFSVTPEGFGRFLCAVYDEWMRIGPARLSIRDFDSMLRFHLEGQQDLCTYRRNCGSYLLVEYNGDVYPCDFFADAKWKLGRVGERHLHEFFDTEKMERFIRTKGERFGQCENCPWRKGCFGGCQKDRLVFGSIEAAPSYLCPGYKMFFEHSQAGFAALAKSLRERSSRQR